MSLRVILSIVFILLGLAVIGFLFLPNLELQNLNFDNSDEVNQETDDSDEGNAEVSGGGSGSGAGQSQESGGVLGTGFSLFCEEKRTPYSLQNFRKEFNCISYQGDFCIQAEVGCLVDVHNLGIAGDFEMKFVLKKQGQFVEERIKSDFVGASEVKTFEEIFDIEDLNDVKEEYFECEINTIETPKEEC